METVAEHIARTTRNAGARETLTKAGITELLATSKRRKSFRKSKHFYMIRDENGLLIRVTGKAPTESKGGYIGKQASKRRSRKGATRPIAGTGGRYYVSEGRWDGTEAVMY